MIDTCTPLKIGALIEIDGRYVNLGFLRALEVQEAITPDGQMVECPKDFEPLWAIDRFRIEELTAKPHPLLRGIVTITLNVVSVYSHSRKTVVYDAGHMRFVEAGTPPTEKCHDS